MNLTSHATAGTASDALRQCSSKSDAAEKAILALNIKDLFIVRKMYKFALPNSGNPYGVAQLSSAPTGTKVSQVIRVKLSGIKSMKQNRISAVIASVFDATNKVGVGLSPSSNLQLRMSGMLDAAPVEYTIEDATSLRRAALRDALSKAKEIRDTFKTSGVQLGKLVGVSYNRQSVTDDPNNIFMRLMAQAAHVDNKSATSNSPEKVAVVCAVTLRYEALGQTEPTRK